MDRDKPFLIHVILNRKTTYKYHTTYYVNDVTMTVQMYKHTYKDIKGFKSVIVMNRYGDRLLVSNNREIIDWLESHL